MLINIYFVVVFHRPKVPNILEIVDINGHAVDWIVSKLDISSDIGKKFMEIIRRLARNMNSNPLEGTSTLSSNFMIKFMKQHDFGFNIGSIGGFGAGSLKFGDTKQLASSMTSMATKSNLSNLSFCLVLNV